MLVKDRLMIAFVLAAVTTLCALRMVSPEIWMEAIRWTVVPYMVVTAISLIPWRGESIVAQEPVKLPVLQRGIFRGGWDGLGEEVTDEVTSSLDAEEPDRWPWPPVVAAPAVKRGVIARLFGSN